jgi:hypothetical protein
MWLWRRGDDTALHAGGDRGTYEVFRGVVDQAID